MNVTTDKVVTNRSDRVLDDALGLVHYSVLVDNVPSRVRGRFPWLPERFIVKMCELVDAYDHASSWQDFVYPTWFLSPEQEHDGVPTCIRCSGV